LIVYPSSTSARRLTIRPETPSRPFVRREDAEQFVEEVRGDDPRSRRSSGERVAGRDYCPAVMGDFHHGHEPRAEEIALHQKYLTLEGQIDAARLEGDEAEVRRLTPLVKRAKTRWIKANRRVTRGT
jgi:hypothetical protein